MGVSFQTLSNSGSASTSATSTVTKPTGTTDGDLLIVALGSTDSGGNEAINSVPSGWTLIDSSNVSPRSLFTYQKIASSEPASWDWGWNGSGDQKSWVCFRFMDAKSSAPINAHAIDTETNSATPSFTTTITPSVADCMLLMIVYSRQNSSTTSGYAIATDNPSWTERLDSAQAASINFAAATATRTQTTATGNSSCVFDGGAGTEDSVCNVIAIERTTTFAANLSETVTTTDTLSPQTDYTFSQVDTISTSDTMTGDKERTWSHQTKNIPTWDFQDES